MGYSFHLTKLGKDEPVVERTGLVQISSSPTGATVTLDGGTPLLLRTNTSRTLSSGTHEISLTKDGYDSWSKTVEITEGMMYRLNYPKLFLTKRETESVTTAEALRFASVSPDRESLLIFDDSGFSLLNLSGSKPTVKPFNFLSLFGLETTDGIEQIEELAWSGNSKKLLLNLNGRLALLDLETPANSLYLDQLLNNIKTAEFETGSGERLLALSTENKLFELDLKSKTLSAPLLSHVFAFDNNEDKLLFLSNETSTLSLRTYRVGDETSYLLKTLPETTEVDSVRFAWTAYFGEYFFALATDSKLEILSAESWIDEVPESLLETSLKPLKTLSLDFFPARLTARGKGLFFSLEDSSGTKKAVFDLEAEALVSFEIQHQNAWVDEFLRYEVSDEGDLWVTDYDGNNWRSLASGLAPSSLVFLSHNGKYLYYFTSSGLMCSRIS